MLELYTDGSAGPSNPGPGGWAVTTETQVIALGWAPHTSNNRMEGIAILEALQWLAGRDAIIHSDSNIWVGAVNHWAAGWESRGWRKTNGEEPANLDLVKQIVPLTRRGNAQVKWIRGHNGTRGNELADHWATQARLHRQGKHVDMKRNPF